MLGCTNHQTTKPLLLARNWQGLLSSHWLRAGSTIHVDLDALGCDHSGLEGWPTGSGIQPPPWVTHSSASWILQGFGVWFLTASLNLLSFRRCHCLLPSQKAVLGRPCPHPLDAHPTGTGLCCEVPWCPMSWCPVLWGVLMPPLLHAEPAPASQTVLASPQPLWIVSLPLVQDLKRDVVPRWA